VSHNRQAKHIARDIERRMMPDYITLLDKVLGIATTYKHNMEQLDHIEQGFKKIVPYLRPYSDNKYSQHRRFTFEIPNAQYRSGDLEISYYKRQHCDLKLPDIPIEIAMRIMALLQEEKGKEE